MSELVSGVAGVLATLGARPTWDEYGLILAHAAATRADCTRARVGAAILDRKRRVLSLGYNGLPAGVPGCASAGNCPRGRLSVDECPRDSDYANCAAVHAEANAIYHADPYELPGATLYVTRQPCPQCATLIESARISRVVVSRPERSGQGRNNACKDHH